MKTTKTRKVIFLAVLAVSIGFIVFGLKSFDYGRVMTSPKAQTWMFLDASYERALKPYHDDTGSYPTTAQGLMALITAPVGVNNWHGPYMVEMPKDHWGNEYQYICPGVHNPNGYDLWSWGPHKGQDSSIMGNWEMNAPPAEP